MPILRVKLQDASLHLAELLEEAAKGRDVAIVRDDGAQFKILPVKLEKPRPKFGSAKGLVTMSDDFDAPLDDFAAYSP